MGSVYYKNLWERSRSFSKMEEENARKSQYNRISLGNGRVPS